MTAATRPIACASNRVGGQWQYRQPCTNFFFILKNWNCDCVTCGGNSHFFCCLPSQVKNNNQLKVWESGWLVLWRSFLFSFHARAHWRELYGYVSRLMIHYMVRFSKGGSTPASFSSFRTENYFSSQQDSNSDRRSRRRERWPLDHHLAQRYFFC